MFIFRLGLLACAFYAVLTVQQEDACLGCGFYHHRLNLGSGIGPEAGGFIGMPVMNGIQAAYEIRRIAPSTKILFFTMHKNEALSGIRLRGAEAFVTKSAAGTELIPALKRLVQAEN
jgi:DNA-binding NarL/FixJ family response regulator